jgi:hypothetical protein
VWLSWTTEGMLAMTSQPDPECKAPAK